MNSTSSSSDRLPVEVVTALGRCGGAIRTARLSRGMTAADLAERLSVTLPTLRGLETGRPGVSLGTLLTALWIFGLLDAFSASIDPANDRIGRALAEARLPKRARRRSLRAELDDL